MLISFHSGTCKTAGIDNHKLARYICNGKHPLLNIRDILLPVFSQYGCCRGKKKIKKLKLESSFLDAYFF